MLEEAKRVSNGVVSFDTQRVIDRLREGGWDEGQARALCDVLREIMRGVAMASDIERVEYKIERVESSLRGEIKGVKSSLEGRMVAMEGRMVALEGQIASLRLVMLAGFGFLGILVALGNFL